MQNNTLDTNCIEEDEIDLRELFKTIWMHKYKIIIFTFIMTSLTIIYTLSIPNSYKSSVVLAPQDQSSAKSSLGGLSALAGMAGVSLGGGSMDAYNSLNTIINDYGFQKMLVEKYNLSEKLSPKAMDKNLVFALNIKSIYHFFHSNKKDDRSKNEIEYDTIKKLKKIVSIGSDKKSGAITLSVVLPDRFFAKKLLEIYLEESTNYLRKTDMLDINKKLSYYKKELANINDIDLKTQVSQLMSSLVQQRVLAASSEFYIVKEMTKPEVAYIKNKAKPKRALIVIVAFITSIILAIFGVFFIEFLKNSKEDDQPN